MTTAESDVSVIIPLFNREGLIGETLAAVLGQTLAPAAIIVVDDGSTDRSVDAVAAFGDRVRLIRNAHRGVQAARNAGIAVAQTPWVALCDSDDLWHPRWLEQVTELRRAAPWLDLIFGNFLILQEDTTAGRTKFAGAPPGYWETAGCRDLGAGWVFDKTVAPLSFTWHPMFPSAMAFTKGLALRVGGFDVALAGRRGEDGEFTLRLLYQAKVGAIPEPLVTIRKHSGNATHDPLANLIDEVWGLEFIKQKHPEALPYHDIIDREIAMRSIAAADAAFAAGDHGLVRQLVGQVPWSARPLKLYLKHAVACLPKTVAAAVNALLQRIAEAR